MTIQTSHPSTAPGENLNNCITFSKIFATEYAESLSEKQFPVIPSKQEWNEWWELAWNFAFAYCSEGLTTSQLYEGI